MWFVHMIHQRFICSQHVIFTGAVYFHTLSIPFLDIFLDDGLLDDIPQPILSLHMFCFRMMIRLFFMQRTFFFFLLI